MSIIMVEFVQITIRRINKVNIKNIIVLSALALTINSCAVVGIFFNESQSGAAVAETIQYENSGR